MVWHPKVEACSEAVEAAGADCKALIKTCMDFLVSHGPEMKDRTNLREEETKHSSTNVS